MLEETGESTSSSPIYRFAGLRHPRQDGLMSPRVVPVSSPDGVLALVKTLGDPVNVEIVRFLAVTDTAAFGEIMGSTGFARATLSKHLRALQEIGVVVGDLPENERLGKHVRYSLNRAGVEDITQRHLAYMLGADFSPPAAPTG